MTNSKRMTKNLRMRGSLAYPSSNVGIPLLVSAAFYLNRFLRLFFLVVFALVSEFCWVIHYLAAHLVVVQYLHLGGDNRRFLEGLVLPCAQLPWNQEVDVKAGMGARCRLLEAYAVAPRKCRCQALSPNLGFLDEVKE